LSNAGKVAESLAAFERLESVLVMKGISGADTSMYRFLYINVSQLWKAHEPTHTRTCEHNGEIAMQRLAKLAKYAGGLVCTFGGVYLGNAYGAGYWRFGPLNLAWDTIFRGTILVLIGFALIRISK